MVRRSMTLEGTTRRAVAVCLATLLMALVGVGTARAQDPAGQEARHLVGGIMSPFCPGLTLAACPSPAAAELRIEIGQRFRQGEAREAILQDLVSRYGDHILGTPPASGVGLLVWIVPGTAGLLLLLAMYAAGRRSSAASSPVSPDDQPADSVLRQRLDEELADLS